MKGEAMSIDQLELILYDMYHMDAWMPPLFGKWTAEFKKASYSQWAVDELKDFIAGRKYRKANCHKILVQTVIRIILRR